MDFVDKTRLFNELGDNKIAFNPRKIAFYIGMILEESAETVSALNADRIQKLNDLILMMDSVATDLKNGVYDDLVEGADIIEIIDGAADVGVVGVGTIMATGRDPQAVMHHVADSNLSKFEQDENGNLYPIKNEQGKIMKGSRYFRPDLTQFETITQ